MAAPQSIALSPRAKNLTDRRFGRLVAQQPVRLKDGTLGWYCLCDCGQDSSVLARSLVKGITTSCGCKQKSMWKQNLPSRRTHGMKGTPVYKVWSNMKERCQREGHKSYADYGGRGITVCDRWLSFEEFYADMGDPPKGYTIERDDVNGNYEKGNCRWVPMPEQYLNRRDTHYLTAFGETKPAVLWAKDPRCKATKVSLYKRLEAGWSDERAITTPMRMGKAWGR